VTALALSTTQAILLTLVGAVLLMAAVAGLLYSRRRPSDVPDIPPAMQPGPSDTDLEKPNLERLQGWGLLLIVFFVVWIPLTWLFEPDTNRDDEAEFTTLSIERGERGVELFTEENPGGVGCVQCHGPELQGGQNRFQGNVVAVPALNNVCSRLTTEQIVQTVEEGREGTDMPSWSIRFAGSLNDQQIQEIVNYIISINLENVPEDQNKCLDPTIGTTPSPEESPGAGEESPGAGEESPTAEPTAEEGA
jgi:mono/diheme cytochrome c family protein